VTLELASIFVIVFIVNIAISWYAFGAGIKRGTLTERHRCEYIVRQSWETEPNLSPTARRIYYSICHGLENLISKDDFFG